MPSSAPPASEVPTIPEARPAGGRGGSLLSLCLFFAGACTPTGKGPEPEPILTVSQIASDRHGFDGKVVTVEGYLSWSWEGGALFDTEVAEANADATRGILLFGNRRLAGEDHFCGTYARVEGLFRADKELVWHGIIGPTRIVPLRRFRDMKPPPKEFEGSPAEKKARIDAIFENIANPDPEVAKARRERQEYVREYLEKRDQQ